MKIRFMCWYKPNQITSFWSWCFHYANEGEYSPGYRYSHFFRVFGKEFILYK